MSNAIAYAFRLGIGETHRKVLCLECCGGEPPTMAREVHDTDRDRARFGVPSDDQRVIVCHECGERLDGGVFLRVNASEIPVLRYALDHALSSISEAHPQDRAMLQALIEKLEKGARS